MHLDEDSITRNVFFPRRAPVPSALPRECTVLEFHVNNNITLGGFFFLKDKNLPTLLLFHGNGEIAHDYLDVAHAYMACGVNFAVADYRGYGFSNGAPTYSSLQKDCFKVFHGTRSHIETSGCVPSIVVMGRSLGSVCAAELGSKYPVGLKGVIFESGFADTAAVMERLFGAKGIPRVEIAPYSNDTKISFFHHPTLIIHGTVDFIIPPDEATKIYNALPPNVYKKQVMIDGAGHNDIMFHEEEYFGAIETFINDIK